MRPPCLPGKEGRKEGWKEGKKAIREAKFSHALYFFTIHHSAVNELESQLPINISTIFQLSVESSAQGPVSRKPQKLFPQSQL